MKVSQIFTALLEETKSLPKLLHISFDDSLEGVMNPRDPVSDDNNSSKFPEPEQPRVCFSPTVKQCFIAIYPNVSKFFEKENYPYMDFYVYQAMLTGDERIVYPGELTNQRKVHDAHVTDEHWVLDPVRVKKIQHVRIKNTNNNGELNYRPFGDPNEHPVFLAPKNIKIDVVDRY